MWSIKEIITECNVKLYILLLYCFWCVYKSRGIKLELGSCCSFNLNHNLQYTDIIHGTFMLQRTRQFCELVTLCGLVDVYKRQTQDLLFLVKIG